MRRLSKHSLPSGEKIHLDERVGGTSRLVTRTQTSGSDHLGDETSVSIVAKGNLDMTMARRVGESVVMKDTVVVDTIDAMHRNGRDTIWREVVTKHSRMGVSVQRVTVVYSRTRVLLSENSLVWVIQNVSTYVLMTISTSPWLAFTTRSTSSNVFPRRRIPFHSTTSSPGKRTNRL